MTKPATIQAHGGDIVLYRAKDGRTALDVRLEQDTIWLSLNQIATLFDRDNSVVSRHLRNVFEAKELDHESTVAFFATVQHEGGHAVERQIEFFNLDAVISVGYPSIDEKAAHLLYFVVKNHAFVDGNKRIGAFHKSVVFDDEVQKVRGLL